MDLHGISKLRSRFSSALHDFRGRGLIGFRQEVLVSEAF